MRCRGYCQEFSPLLLLGLVWCKNIFACSTCVSSVGAPVEAGLKFLGTGGDYNLLGSLLGSVISSINSGKLGDIC